MSWDGNERRVMSEARMDKLEGRVHRIEKTLTGNGGTDQDREDSMYWKQRLIQSDMAAIKNLISKWDNRVMWAVKIIGSILIVGTTSMIWKWIIFMVKQ